jgi:predicted GNAT superfamily acetyltransferase
MILEITYHRASTSEELHQILKLQQQNLRESLSSEEKQTEGFVTLQHDFEMLKKMNDACAHCVAKLDGRIVGYALSMRQDFKNDIPLLVPMFDEIDKAIKQQPRLLNYIAMGQICVDKKVRGQGVLKGLYHYMAQQLKNDFDAIITEVDTSNVRSSNAHKAVGFKLLKNYTSNDQLWEIISLEI